MNTIASVTARVVQNGCHYSAHAVLNGRPTSQSCQHLHKRSDLADKCLGKVADRWLAIAESDHSLALVPDWMVGAPVYEVAHSEVSYLGMSRVRTRFCFLDETLPHPSDKVQPSQTTKETAQ